MAFRSMQKRLHKSSETAGGAESLYLQRRIGSSWCPPPRQPHLSLGKAVSSVHELGSGGFACLPKPRLLAWFGSFISYAGKVLQHYGKKPWLPVSVADFDCPYSTDNTVSSSTCRVYTSTSSEARKVCSLGLTCASSWKLLEEACADQA